VVFQGDGGGKAQALGNPLAGRERVIRLLLGLLRRGRTTGASLRPVRVNGRPGAVLYDAEGHVVSVVELDVGEGAGGVVQVIHAVVNPDKLGHVGTVSDVARVRGKQESAARLVAARWPAAGEP
jgi:RNA polymerase sigma-70 factor (ECF subfamily)